ncbi:MAG TPA: amino acid--tRNA ligase-related protein [Candidatus Wunengus sp. YC63]
MARPTLEKRHEELTSSPKRFLTLVEVFDSVHKATVSFMASNGVYFFNLPILTRMISSPGALTGTIPSDVAPFRVDYFGKEAFLTQSSQLYLELALCIPGANAVYCWDKSFRNEKSDFRHLPEFTHIEFESKIGFDENIDIQKKYFENLLDYLCNNSHKALEVFLTSEDLQKLESFCSHPVYEILTFVEAFRLLYENTNDDKYKTPTLSHFSTIEEVLLTQILNGRCVFVTQYLSDEVAFYHANTPEDKRFVINADFLGAGYGELIGSGERLHTAEEIEEKAAYFKLSIEDYRPYISSRHSNAIVHSGWGMGIERFIQFVLKLPAIWEVSLFPRVDWELRP